MSLPTQVVKCLVCLEHLTGQVFQCTTGHTYCHLCLLEGQICPVCDDILKEFCFTNPPIQTIAPLLYPCPHRGLGCYKMYNQDALQAHVDNCRLRPFSCIFNMAERPCQFVGTGRCLETHIIRHHKEVPIFQFDRRGEKILHFSDKVSRFVALGQSEGRAFILYIVPDGNRKFVYMGLQVIGHTDFTTPISYEITLKNNTGQVILFREHCRSCRENMDTNMKSGFYPSLPVPILDFYRTEGNQIQCLLRIVN